MNHKSLVLSAINTCATIAIVICIGTFCIVGFGFFCRLVAEAWRYGFNALS